MISILGHTFTVAVIFFLNFELYCCPCGRAEYETSGECCPMCSPGNRVYRHCTEFTSTICTACVDSTYTDKMNNLSKCISCKVCDMGAGLRVKTPCTRISNTVCKPLEGFFCIDEDKGSCRQAVEHTKCKPGQYMKQKGTAVSNVECAVCLDGTYSNGSLQICQPYTKCEDLGLEEKTKGKKSFDVECGPKAPVALITMIIVIVVAIVLVVSGALFFIKIYTKHSPRGFTAEVI
ncbi:tumor necrosis factor receptor superfamily member 14-like isoform 1-T2 [Clarias gariepinus]